VLHTKVGAPLGVLALRSSGFLKKRLHRLEQFEPISLHHDRVCAFGEFDVAFVGRVDQQREKRLRHIGRRIVVPFRTDQQRRHRDLGWIVIWLACAKESEAVRDNAIRGADDWGVGIGAFRISRPCGVRPGFKLARRNKRRLFVLGYARVPTLLGHFACDRAISGERTGVSLDQRWCLANPDGRVQEESLDFFCVPRCVSGHESGAPRPTEQIETGDVASFENEIDNAADILDRSVFISRVHRAFPTRVATISVRLRPQQKYDELAVQRRPAGPLQKRW